MDNDPDRLALVIMDMRAFERTWRAIDKATSKADVPTGEMADRVGAAMGRRLSARLGKDS